MTCNLSDNQYMGTNGKSYPQIKINFDSEVKAQFDRECEDAKMGQGALASAILLWYMRQPTYMKSLIIHGMKAIPPGAAPAAARSIAMHLLDEAGIDVTEITPALPDEEPDSPRVQALAERLAEKRKNRGSRGSSPLQDDDLPGRTAG